MKAKLSFFAAAAIVFGSGALAAVTVDVKPAKAFTYEEYRQCMIPFEEDYGRSMKHCNERIAPRYGVSSIEYETCVWYAQTPYDTGNEYCSNLYL